MAGWAQDVSYGPQPPTPPTPPPPPPTPSPTQPQSNLNVVHLLPSSSVGRLRLTMSWKTSDWRALSLVQSWWEPGRAERKWRKVLRCLAIISFTTLELNRSCESQGYLASKLRQMDILHFAVNHLSISLRDLTMRWSHELKKVEFTSS